MTVATTNYAAVQNPIVVKVQYEDDIRRFSFAGTSFNALKEEIFRRYNFKPQARVTLKYTDEENDLITVSDDVELADAINIAGKQGTLRLVLSVIKRKVPVDVAPAGSAPITVPNTTATSGVVPPPVPIPVANAGCPRQLDRQAKLERMQQWREAKHAMWEQKRAAKTDKKAYQMAVKTEKKCAKREKSVGPKYLARFVKDVGVEDGTELAPGTKFIKTWRFRNEGTEAWPAGSKLLFISWKGGDQMGGPESIPVPDSVLPGAEVDVGIELTAPIAPGRYAGHYRLATIEGRKFGDRVRNLIYVVDPSSTSSSSEEEQNCTAYAAAIAQLDQMGFHNKKWNAKLLRKFNGDLHKTIKKLVKKQKKADRKKH